MARSTAVVFDLIARDHASRTVMRVGESFSGLEKKSAGVGAALRRGLTVGATAVAGLGAISVKAAADFQASMTKISTQAGGSAKDVKVLSDQVLSLGGKVQQAPKELADSLYHLKSVGMDNADAMKALKQASDLAAVGGASLEETTNALAGAWRTGIRGAGSFHEAVSTVNAIIGAGNMRMEDFNAAIGTGILASAKTFGLSLKQVGSALALMTDEGIPATDAATRLRMSFSLLGAPSKAAEKQLKKIGLTGLQLGQAMRSPQGIIGAIQLLKDHLDKSGMSAAQQSQILSRAFGGGRSSSGILTLINNLDVLKKKQDQVNRSTGKFDSAVKQQRKTAMAQWKMLVDGLETLSVRIGTKILPPVTHFVSWLNSTAMPEAAKFGRTMAGIIPLDKIKKEFGEARRIVGDFFSGLSGKPDVSKAMPRIDRAPEILPASTSKKFGEQIRKAVSGGIGDIDWGKLGGKIGSGLSDAIGWVGKHTDDLTKKLADVLSKIDFVEVGKAVGGAAIPFLIGFVRDLFEPLFHKEFWRKHWMDAILAVVSVVPFGKLGSVLGKIGGKVLEGVGSLLSKVKWQKVIPFAGKLSESVGPTLAAVGRWVGRMARGFGEAFARRFPRISQWFHDQLILLPVRLGDLGRLLKRKAGELVGKFGDWLVSHIPGAGNKFIRAALKVFGRFTLWKIGANLAMSMLRGIWHTLQDVGSWLKKHVVDPVVNWVKRLFGIASPSKVFLSIGRNLVAGLKGGILGAAAGIGSWVWKRVGSPVVGAFSHAGSWLYGKGKSLVSGLENGVLKVAKGIGGWLTRNVKNPTTGVFKSAGSWLTGKGEAVLNGFFSGLKKPYKAVQKWVSGIAGWIKAHKGPISLDRKLLHPAGAALMSGLLSGLKFGFKHVGSFVYNIGDTITGTVSKIFSNLFGGGGKDVSRWSGAVKTVLAMLGAPASALPAVLKRIQMESGGNPGAINLWDSNAKAGHPSQGLMQTIPSTFAAYAGPFRSRGITDGLASIYAGVNYAMHRYGSNWINVMTRPGGYAKGTGGARRGLAWVGERGPELVNFSGGEDVLSHPQSVKFAKAHGIKLPGYASGTILNAADRVRRDRDRVEDAKDALARAKRRHHGVAAAEKKLKAAEKELQAAEISLKNAKRSAKTSISNTLATGFLKKVETGSSSAIASAIKSITTKLLNAGFDKLAKSVMKTGGKLEKLADKRTSVEKTIDTAKQYASDQSSSIRDFLSISGTSATSVSELISQMTGQQKTASGLESEVKHLKARGASKALLAQLAAAGPGSQLAMILGDKNVKAQDIAKLNALVKSGGKLATGFGRSMADMMYDSGKHAGDGFLTGLKAQEKSIQKELDHLAKGMVKAIKKSLKIKSPSQVFRDEVGKQVALGMVVGMDAHRPHIAAAAQRMAHTARRAAVLPSAPARQAAAFDRLAALLASGQAGGAEVHVHFDDDRLRDLIDVRIKPKIKASEDRQAYRAKVGRRG